MKDTSLRRPSGKMWPADILRRVLLALLIIIVAPSILGKLQPVKLLATRNRVMLRRIGISREDKSKVCYDLVGCFAVPPSHLSIKRPPEHPNVIQTKFFLYTRVNRQDPELLEYGDDSKSISHSHFNISKPLKVMIHGYKGSGSDVSLILGEDANIIIPDWTMGAASTYGIAVANSELVGRQLALILLDTINLGINPVNIHVIGFSLGAHVAGCASEMLKQKNLLLSRITGLDPASPFFRHHLFREKSRKLDASDANLVDVIHTDGSQDFTDGFGLLKPIGHIDFFPNGGREQPGCVDIKNSVVVSHLKEDLDRNIACSHLRAWYLFVESIRLQNEECKFTAWPCPQGGMSYIRGMCFPMETIEWSQEMGYSANRRPLGLYYLATRAESPFCGTALRASVMTSEGMPKTSGILHFKIFLSNSTTLFKIQCTLSKRRNEGMMFYNIAAVKFDALLSDTASITGTVSYQRIGNKAEKNVADDTDADTMFFNKLVIEDRKGHRWEYSNMNMAINSHKVYVELRNERCMSL
ncbi:PREDICTED: pancreatic lipase-related protein 2-like isoform X2 [Dinoponera quadriceps]|uniref:phospholipase A1 n=1 Tax=Dinoponera quadriceps TaxID=609295 RepID=A0A6P3XJ30_DINQU|nr:PREDICTED: pancreatic lipase-related protein 2-like isoform X2 [Dinoponera quadriceps]